MYLESIQTSKMDFSVEVFHDFSGLLFLQKTHMVDVCLVSEYTSEDGHEWWLCSCLPNISATFQTKFALCTTTVISGLVSCFLGGNSSTITSLSNFVF